MSSRRNGVRSDGASLAALAQQVYGIEEDQRNIRADITSLQSKIESGLQAIANKLEDRAKTPWGVLITGLGLVIVIAGLIGNLSLNPVDRRVEKLEDNDQHFRQVFMRKDVFDVYDKLVHSLLDRHNDATEVLRNNQEQIRRDLGAIAPPSSTLEELRKRLDRLENRAISNGDLK